MSEYQVKYYQNSHTGKMPVLEYIKKVNKKDRSKIYKYIDYLELQEGYIEEPHGRHIIGKIRELRVDFSNNRHRVFYFVAIRKKVILLHAFLKNTNKTPRKEIIKAINNHNDAINNLILYE